MYGAGEVKGAVRISGKKSQVFFPPKSITMRVSIVPAVSYLLLFLFVYAAVSKLTAYVVFKEQLSRFPGLYPFAPFLAWGLPSLELTAAALLLFERTRLYGLYVSISLLTLFTLYLAGLLLFAPSLPCSCGGVLEALSWKGHLAFNTLFIILNLAGIKVFRKKYPGRGMSS